MLRADGSQIGLAWKSCAQMMRARGPSMFRFPVEWSLDRKNVAHQQGCSRPLSGWSASLEGCQSIGVMFFPILAAQAAPCFSPLLPSFLAAQLCPRMPSLARSEAQRAWLTGTALWLQASRRAWPMGQVGLRALPRIFSFFLLPEVPPALQIGATAPLHTVAVDLMFSALDHKTGPARPCTKTRPHALSTEELESDLLRTRRPAVS
jgi:hypothetical protein